MMGEGAGPMAAIRAQRRKGRSGCAATLRAVLVGTALALAPVLGASAQAETAQEHTLNYRDADIRAFIDDVSMLTGTTFIVDPRVKGQVTVVSNAPMASSDIFDVFLATLRVNGYSVSSMATGAYKILPNEAAVQDAALAGDAGDTDRFVTEVFNLRHVDGATAQNMLKPLINDEGRVVANRGSDFLVVVDYASNMGRIRQVIRDIDRDLSVFTSVPLQNTAASEMARIVGSLKASDGEAGAKNAVNAVAIDGTNTLILRGDRQAVARMAQFVQDLDSRNVNRKPDVRVIPLRYAEAEDLMPLLQQVSASMVRAEQADGTPVSNPDAKVHIAFHKATNALVINADADMLMKLQNVIEELDKPRPQVLVEAIIVEVSDQAARELGLQYVLSGDGANSRIPFTATSFSNTAPNILAATGALVVGNEVDDDDDTTLVTQLQQAAIDSLLGVSGFVGGVAGQASDGTIFGVILNALQSDTDSNVLSTPSIMTLDNETASIHVGQEIPITTGEVLGQNFENPFRQVAREDVGIKLIVTPQITNGLDTGRGAGDSGRSIKLAIRQEASSIFGPVTKASADLILNKRELETNVMIDDGEIVVLGGLIEQDEQVSVEKVPLLGDVPVVGRLFQSKGRSKSKTNLMVFLRPTIVSERSGRETATARQYDAIREQQLGYGASETSTLDYFTTDVLQGRVPADGGAN